MKKVLFIESVHDVLQQRLEEAGYICEKHYQATRAEILEMLPDYFGVVIRSRITADEEFFSHAPQLKFIARSGSGLENIHLHAAEAHGVLVVNSPEGNRDAVGEHAVGMLLMLFNNLKQADMDVRSGKWPREENRGIEISGKTIGIIGYGMMGSAFAEKLRGFRANIIVYDKYKSGFGSESIREVTLEEIYHKADIVSIHLPLNDETHYYVNQEFFEKFKKPIYFINTSRGKNLDTSALVKALQEGKVLGACLDVIEYEKMSLEGLETNSQTEDLRYLIGSNQVVLSPHVAGWTHESYFKLSNVLAEKILHVFGKNLE